MTITHVFKFACSLRVMMENKVFQETCLLFAGAIPTSTQTVTSEAMSTPPVRTGYRPHPELSTLNFAHENPVT